MEEPAKPAESSGPAEDPPPPISGSAQDRSRSESLLDSTADSASLQKRPPPPPSPLTGCYLLIVVGEPHSDRHKEIILQKIAKGFLSWDVNECHVSLEKELQAITVQSPEGEEGRYGERLIQYATENLVTEILIHPQLNTLHQCMRNLLSSFTKHRHIIHAGYTFAGNGSWILQDGTLSISDLVEALHETEVLRVLKAYENSVSIDVHCAPEGEWSSERFQREPVSKLCSVRINPDDVVTAGDPAISGFIDYLAPFLEPANIQQLLQPTDVVGNIRFTHPTLYVFPGGQGDAALFGINGFNMLVDGGFARKACFWDFARHLDRLDAVLLTRLNNSTVNGISAVLRRKKMNHVYPQIGHFFCNLQDRKIALSPDGDKDKDSLIVSLAEEGQEIVANLRHLALKPHPCYRDGNQVDPVNLYHKVGHGKLDMYVLSPARDSQAVKEFLSKWSANDDQLFSNTGKKIGAKGFDFPLQNLVSICALLVWQPANPNDAITRILFPGSTPQHKIFEGLDKLRHLEFLKHPICSARSISPSASTVTVARSLSKTRQVQAAERAKAQAAADQKSKDAKPIADQKPKSQTRIVRAKADKSPPKEVKPKPDTNKLIEEKKEVEKSKTEPVKKIDDRMFDKDEQLEKIEKEIQKIENEHAIQKIAETDIKKMEQNEEETEKQIKKIVHRSKYDMKNVKSKVDSRAPSKSTDRKKLAEKKTENGGSPPGTPKKGLMNGTATKAEKVKTVSKPTKASPSATPAKSAKEANNRKVVEARVVSRASSVSRTSRVAPKKEETPSPAPASSAAPPKTERKPISRRPKAPSPAKKTPASPVRSAAAKGGSKAEQDAAKKVKRKLPADLEKATTDSTVSTPSAEAETAVPKKGPEEKPSEPESLAQNVKTDLDDVTEETAKSKEVDETTENIETDDQAVKDEIPTESDKIPLTSKLSQESARSGESERSQKGDLPEEEDEYLIITKEDSTDESGKAAESEKENENENESLQEEIETKDETEGEGETKKILRDEEDSEKRRKFRDEQVEKELQEEVERDDKADEPTRRIDEIENETEEPRQTQKKDELDAEREIKSTLNEEEEKEEVQETVESGEDEAKIIKQGDEAVKKTEGEGSEESPQEKSSDRKETRESDLQKLTDPDEGVDLKEPVSKEHKEGESLPDEKFSTTVETSATTAPTLPEDERIEEPILEEENKVQLDEIKEVVEEKYIKEETKEDKQSEEVKSRPEQPSTLPKTSPPPPPPAYESNQPRPHPRDIVKTPDEVADLPVHEEVDPGMYSSGEFARDLHKHEDESKEGDAKMASFKDEKESVDLNKKSDFKETIKGEANLLDEEDTEETRKVEIVDKTIESTDDKTEGKKDNVKVEPELESDVVEHAEETKASGKADEVKDIAVEALTTKYLDIIDKLEKTSESADHAQSKEKPLLDEDSKESAIEDEQIKQPPVALDKEETDNLRPAASPADKTAETVGERRAGPAAQELKQSSKAPSPVPSDDGSPLPKAITEPIGQVAVSSESTRSQEATPEPDRKASIGEKAPGLDADQIPLSGKSTPHLSDKDSRQPTPSPVEKEGLLSGKITPESGLESDSARSTPALEPEKAPVRNSSISSGKASPEKAVTSTIETCPPPKLDAVIISERLSPCLDDQVLSGNVSPEKERSGKQTPVSGEKIPSGKATPTLEKDGHGRTTPTSLTRVSSGRTTPVEKVASGKATPTSEKDGHGRTTPTSLTRVSSGRTTPVEKSASGKSTPILDEREASRKSSLAEDEKTAADQNKMCSIAENVLSGETETEIEVAAEQTAKTVSSPIPSSASGKTSPHAPEKDSSGKISPVQSDRNAAELISQTQSEQDFAGKKSPEQIDKVLSGKTTPALSDKSGSGKITPDVVEKLSGKTSPARSDVEASGKTTPDKIVSGKATPQSEKSTPGNTTPDVADRVPSGKTTPNVEDKIPSRQATPIRSEIDASEQPLAGISSPSPCGEKDVSGKTTPDVSDKAGSGKITPAPSEKGLSGKATPEIPEKSASGKTTPGLSDKGTPGKITPVSEKTESGKVTPSDLADKSPEKGKVSTPSGEKETCSLSGKQTPIGNLAAEETISPSREKDTQKSNVPPSVERCEISPETTTDSDKESPFKEEIARSAQSSGKATPITEPEKDKQSGRSSTEGKIPQSPLEVASSPAAAIGSPDIPAASGGKSSPSQVLDRKSAPESSGKNTPSEKLPFGKSTPLEKLTNGIYVAEESYELEKGILESERHEKESHVSEEISSDEDEELKALEQADDNEDSGPDEEITRERLQSLAHGEITTATPDSVSESPAVKKTAESEISSESPKLDADKVEKETNQDGHESPLSIRKDKKDDINELVKSGKSSEDGTVSAESENHAAVKRMLVTASSEDGGTETEICAQGSIRLSKSEAGGNEDKDKGSSSPESSDADDDGKGQEFSSLILQARKEYNLQRSRKSSCNSPERQSPDEGKESFGKESREEQASPNQALTEDSTDTISTEQSSVLQKTEISKEVETNGWTDRTDTDVGKILSKSKTTSRSESSTMDEADIITITTILTEEREEQEDGTYKVTTTKEVVTKGGKEPGTVVTVNTDVVKADDSRLKSPTETKSPEEVTETSKPKPKPTGTDESRVEGEEPSSPLSVTSQLSPSPTPGFDFDDYRRSTCGDFDSKTAEERKSSTSSTIAFTEPGKSLEENVSVETTAKTCPEDSADKDPSRKSSTGSQDDKRPSSMEESEAKLSQGDQDVVGQREESRRTSASSTISQEDLVSRKDSTRIEEFRAGGSVELSPLKTTYITSQASSDAGESQLMTSSFYGVLPTEDEMILSASYAAGKPEISSEIRKGKGYESVTEIGPDGEKTERTYFYGTDPEPSLASGGGFYMKGIPEPIPEAPEITPDKPSFVETFSTKESFLSEEDMDFAKAVEEHKSARGEDLSKNYQFDLGKLSSDKSLTKRDVDKIEEVKKSKPEVSPPASSQSTSSSSSSALETKSDGKEETPSAEKKKDVIEGWGKPLGLPLPPKNTNRTTIFPGQNISTTSSLSTPSDNSDSVTNWGQPMSLPSPAPPIAQNGSTEPLTDKSGSVAKDTPKKEKRSVPTKKNDNKSSGNNTPNRRSESPIKPTEKRAPSLGRNNKPINTPIYLDLTYVPHHGNSYYSNVEFFKRIRARYYVFSGTEPSREVYNALLEAKQTWDDKDLEVTIIPTYDTDVLGYWVAENEEVLAKHKIDLSPSASRCTINLQDHETSCSAYRLEF